MTNKINKKGADKIISVYWFVILFIVAAAIVYMTISFYGKPYDVRELEADALTNRVADCISEAGYLKEEALTQNFKENFLALCGLNFDTEDVYDWKQRGQYYVELEMLNFNSKERVSDVISGGNVNLKEFCSVDEKNFPFCLNKSFYVVDKNNVQYQVNILSVVRKTEKNVQ